MRIEPEPPNVGLRFRLAGGVTVAADPANVVDTQRATVLGAGGERVSTVEHLLSALSGMGITNATIAVDGPEIPALDGSALPYVEAIAAVGVREQGVARAVFAPDRPHAFRDGDRLVVVLPAPAFRVRVATDFAPPIGAGYLELDVTPERYVREIAPNRTFGYRREVEALLARGLAAGGSLDNAVVFDDDGPMAPLRAPNEPVRHKALDLIGDFALLGAYPQCEIIAIKSGHGLHCAAVAGLRAAGAVA